MSANCLIFDCIILIIILADDFSSNCERPFCIQTPEIWGFYRVPLAVPWRTSLAKYPCLNFEIPDLFNFSQRQLAVISARLKSKNMEHLRRKPDDSFLVFHRNYLDLSFELSFVHSRRFFGRLLAGCIVAM